MHGDMKDTHEGHGGIDYGDGFLETSVLLQGLDAATRQSVLESLDGPRAVEDGDHLVRRGDPFRDLHLVQSGSFKAYADDTMGREHLMGFFLPGDVVGFDAIQTGRYRASFSALGPSSIYSISYLALTDLFGRFPDLSAAVFRMMSQQLVRTEVLAGDYTAQELLAGFIMMLSRRYARAGRPRNEILLSMSRRDLANYLRLAPETVSRLFTRFAREGLIRVGNRTLTLVDPEQLLSLAGPLREL